MTRPNDAIEANGMFDESLLSGYLDGVLTQADEQKVRLFLEESEDARKVLDELKSVRNLTLASDFARVADDQWDEQPQGGASGAAFRIGWTLFLLWLVAGLSFVAYQFATGPESIFSKAFVFVGVSGVSLLFLSVLIDRLKRLGSDRYRGVKR